MSTTIVTALYDIGRETMKNQRSFSTYLSWFETLLTIDCPMVIFVEAKDNDFIFQRRSANNTKIININFSDLPLYRHRSAIAEAQQQMRDDYPGLGYLHYNPEFTSPDYPVVVFSKFDFLLQTTQQNPFNSEYFIWLDAGTFRHQLPFTGAWPDPDKMVILGDRFLISDYHFDHRYYDDKYSYLITNQNRINAHILGGKAGIIAKVCSDVYNLLEKALDHKVVNNEQILLQLLIIDNPDDYYLWPYQCYQNYPLPTNERMIPYQLAVGTYLTQDYPIEPRLQVVILNGDKNQYHKECRDNARHFGYRLNYRIDSDIPYCLAIDEKTLFTKPAKQLVDDYLNRKKTITKVIDGKIVAALGESKKIKDLIVEGKVPDDNDDHYFVSCSADLSVNNTNGYLVNYNRKQFNRYYYQHHRQLTDYNCQAENKWALFLFYLIVLLLLILFLIIFVRS